jgi:hypothetical protein
MAEEKEPVKINVLEQWRLQWRSGFVGKVKLIFFFLWLSIQIIGYITFVYLAPLAIGYFAIGLLTYEILKSLLIDPILFDWVYGVMGAIAALATTRFVNSILKKQKAAQRLADERAQARNRVYLEEQARLKEAMTEAEWAIYSAQLETQKLLRQGQAAEARRQADSLRPQFGYFMNWPPKF